MISTKGIIHWRQDIYSIFYVYLDCVSCLLNWIGLNNTKIGSECGNKLIRKFRANHVRRIGDAESNIDLFRRQMINGEMEIGYYMAKNDEKMRKSKKVKS